MNSPTDAPEAPAPAVGEAAPPAVRQASGWLVPAMWLLTRILRLWIRTLRVEASPEAVALAREPGPVMLLIWHNRLFMSPWVLRVLRPHRTVSALVSASSDGAALACAFKFLGMHTVRGSSSKFGREALLDLIESYRAGYDMAVTPDGPRGPMYDMKAGALLAARRTRSPLVLLGFSYRRAWRARSWDRFGIPWVFSRVVFRCERIEPHSLGHGHEALTRLRERLLAINDEPPAGPAAR